MKINISKSYDNFRMLREDGAYYVDKTAIIKKYLEDHFDSAVLFARPRRFGKTLTMTMFRDFLDIRQDSRDIFEGLEIMKYSSVVDEYMNKYPVVFISLKEIYGENISDIEDSFKLVVSQICKTMEFLLESDNIGDSDKKIFKSIINQEANRANTIAALDLLVRMLKNYYDKRVFVIIDEYDVPMAKTLGTEAYEPTRDMIAHMLSYVCKTNDNVKAVILSGCLFTVKNSTYTGVNNIIPHTVLSPLFAGDIGFTNEDVKKLLEDANISDKYELVKEWYNGYLFGREEMYCPWDVLNFVSSVIDGTYSEAMGPKSYWVNTSETAITILRGFLGKVPNVMEDFETLLAGECIYYTVNENLPYHRMHENGANIWSALVETGYLTKAVKEEMPRMPLRIPNKEIKEVFRQEVKTFFEDKIENQFVDDLDKALWNKDIAAAETSLNQILEATLSFYHEYHEYSYHLLLDGFFTGLEYRVLSEQETGYGRSDLIILDPARSRSMILEIKHAKDDNELETALEEAASQIIDKKYDSILKYQDYKTIVRYGVSCSGKKAKIKLV
ncbi:AAA family ATPase [Pseudobutyrivibrio xylanivorans]|uniref:PD-(D/E)XK nuclease superfamily protein n=1 Tax=Pseudobutyrivibrio xylanivorans TaxID=185007 RepID=A0A1G5RYW5_PSEXY|nr:AAA family ATPase [Pseudobutyrivibrio xylanivorans]SCZ78641.1 PD-(D/E)XK nuclease superfamily protein [Pseudobutyrivibrio xylanivorans]